MPDGPGPPVARLQVIVGLARAFGLRTVAEGVEDSQTLERLRAEGVDYAQGFHIGRPEPIEEQIG